MTTKVLDNHICTFKISLSRSFPRKTAFWDDFPLWPQAPPSNIANSIFIVVSPSPNFDGSVLGSQHPSPNVKTLCKFEPQIWPEIITTHVMPKVLVLKVRGRHVRDNIFRIFWPNFWPEKITSRDGCFLPMFWAFLLPSFSEVFAQFAYCHAMAAA